MACQYIRSNDDDFSLFRFRLCGLIAKLSRTRKEQEENCQQAVTKGNRTQNNLRHRRRCHHHYSQFIRENVSQNFKRQTFPFS